MPFGLPNAGQSFQRFMDEVLSGLDFAFCYLDDILIGSSCTEEHLHHLHLVLQRLQEYGLVLNMEKCELARQEVDFLGHHITADGALPILKHVQAIQDFPAPQDKKQLQTFLGMVNFYRRFIPAAANILLPLTDALRADWSWTWAPAMQHSFQLVKETLAEVATLTHPDPAADLSLAVDASNTHIGAVLQQWQPGGGGGWRPLSFFSKKLDTAQPKYSAFDRELLAAYLSVRHFRYMLDGKKFHILSDHKPLTQALHSFSDTGSPTSDIRHVPGKANVVADALSRPPPSAVASVKEPSGSLATARQVGKPNTSTPSVPGQRSTASAAAGAARPPLSAVVSVKEPAGSLNIAWQRGKPNPSSASPPAPGPSPGSAAAVGVTAATTAGPALSPAAGGVDLSQMAPAQQECAETQDAAALTSLRIEFFPVDGKNLMCDVSLARPRPVVPVSLREAVFASIHSIAHPGIRATKRMVSARFVWDGSVHSAVLPRLPEVRQRKGDLNRSHPDPAHPAAGQAFFSCTHRHSGSSPGLTWRMHSSPHHGGQEHQMGGSGPAGKHIHRQLCSRLLQQLGEPFQGSGCPDL